VSRPHHGFRRKTDFYNEDEIPKTPSTSVLSVFSVVNSAEFVSGQLQHPPHGPLGLDPGFLRDVDLRFEVREAVAQLFKRVQFHVAAIRTRAVVCRAGNEILVRNLAAEPVEHAALSDDDEILRGILATK